jgi:hypothetical protein
VTISASEQVKLLFGPYTLPAFKRGARTNCLYRDCLVIVTTWSDALISWPRCYVPGKSGGRQGLLVDEELARAIRCESAAAVCYWWGVAQNTVVRWRRALDVTRKNNEGTQVLIRAATAQATLAAQEYVFTAEEREVRRQRAHTFRIWEASPPVTYGVAWTPDAVALLGTLPDHIVGERTGHSRNAVHIKRKSLGIPACPRRRSSLPQ